MQAIKHIVQSQEWAEVKNAYGTKAVNCGEIFYTLHNVPFVPFKIAYCPKVSPEVINWNLLKESLKENNCAYINFDVPNVVAGDVRETMAVEGFTKNGCMRATKSTFAESTIVIDLTQSEEDLLKGMHSKHRYNIHVAQKKGVTVEQGKNLNDFNVFFDLLSQTAIRQKYYIRPKHYYQQIWEILKPKNMCYILTAKYNEEPLASWMLFSYQGTFYYPYGGSAEKLQNIFPSNLLGWEAIKLGKVLGCSVFDMWGASNNIDDQNDPWWGFTNFKIKFGGRYVHFMNSYDFVDNTNEYRLFNLANNLRWKMLKFIR